jgi:hypothetical protein
MPPKTRFTKDIVVNAAFKIVRKNGMDSLSAQSIARELNSSIAPIYSQVKSMEKLKEEVVHKIFLFCIDYQTKQRTDNILFDLGIGYVMFALNEKHLFRCINDKKYRQLYRKYAREFYRIQLQRLNNYAPFASLPQEQKHKIMTKGITLMHGTADLIINSNIEYFNNLKSDKKKVVSLLSNFISEELQIAAGNSKK